MVWGAHFIPHVLYSSRQLWWPYPTGANAWRQRCPFHRTCCAICKRSHPRCHSDGTDRQCERQSQHAVISQRVAIWWICYVSFLPSYVRNSNVLIAYLSGGGAQRRAYGFRNFENYRLRVRVLCCWNGWGIDQKPVGKMPAEGACPRLWCRAVKRRSWTSLEP